MAAARIHGCNRFQSPDFRSHSRPFQMSSSQNRARKQQRRCARRDCGCNRATRSRCRASTSRAASSAWITNATWPWSASASVSGKCRWRTFSRRRSDRRPRGCWRLAAGQAIPALVSAPASVSCCAGSGRRRPDQAATVVDTGSGSGVAARQCFCPGRELGASIFPISRFSFRTPNCETGGTDVVCRERFADKQSAWEKGMIPAGTKQQTPLVRGGLPDQRGLCPGGNRYPGLG